MNKKIKLEDIYSKLKKSEVNLNDRNGFKLLQKKIRNQIFIDSMVFIFISFMLLCAFFIIVLEVSGIANIMMSVIFMLKYILIPALFYIVIIVFAEIINSSKGGYYEENQFN
ncbi:MAG: hypothetical protein M0R46_12355 [Candidatus Muirbacterium halophilum]|nr:hypothetical protein [Candidatus Muirbacterium halophilum]MCK9476708.1 hypothetical protein [Candidatus Muirbacterium halophilum]